MDTEEVLSIINLVVPVIMVVANFISRPSIPEPVARSNWMPKTSKHPLIEMDKQLQETVMLEEMWNIQKEVK